MDGNRWGHRVGFFFLSELLDSLPYGDGIFCFRAGQTECMSGVLPFLTVSQSNRLWSWFDFSEVWGERLLMIRIVLEKEVVSLQLPPGFIQRIGWVFTTLLMTVIFGTGLLRWALSHISALEYTWELYPPLFMSVIFGHAGNPQLCSHHLCPPASGGPGCKKSPRTHKSAGWPRCPIVWRFKHPR